LRVKHKKQRLIFLPVDEEPLGKGAFGVVHKALKNPGRKAVAVKTVKEKVTNDTFKAALSELKILAYIGYHPHIVEFIGAITKDIKQCKLITLFVK